MILPNLILGRSVVPEFIQDDAMPDTLSRQLLDILGENLSRESQLAGFVEVEAIMRAAGRSPAANAVDAALALVTAQRH